MSDSQRNDCAFPRRREWDDVGMTAQEWSLATAAEPVNRVYAVVVTYFPDAGFRERLLRIAPQVSRVIVVDNGSEGEAQGHLEKALAGWEDIICFRNGKNIGVGAALNQGVRAAMKEGDCAWIVTFDQDSLPAENMVQTLLSVWKSHPDSGRLMAAGPRTAFVNSTVFPEPGDGPVWREVSHVITSGSLISRKAFEAAGYFNEKLFIDYVDFEYCLRLKTLGYGVIEVQSAGMLHHLGHLEERLLAGKKIHPTHHSPARRYYQFRNALLLHRQFRFSQPAWRRANRIVLLKMLLLILLYERSRPQSLSQILKGIVHGLTGRAGRNGECRYRSPKPAGEGLPHV